MCNKEGFDGKYNIRKVSTSAFWYLFRGQMKPGVLVTNVQKNIKVFSLSTNTWNAVNCHKRGKVNTALGWIWNVEVFGLNVLSMGVVLSDCPGSTDKVISAICSDTTHCKHSHLQLQIQLEEWIHLPVLLDKCCTRYNKHSILYSVHLYFCLSLHIFMLFSGKITSACKKLNKESEHKNFLYTYSWTPVMSYSYKCKWEFAKTKNIEILEINYKNKKIRNASFPHNQSIYRDVYLPTYPLEKNTKKQNKKQNKKK